MAVSARDAEREYRELGNRGFSKLDVVADSVDVYVPSIVHGEIHGRDAYEAVLCELRAGFPDWHVTVGDIFASNEMVMNGCTVTGAHEGEYMWTRADSGGQHEQR